MTIEELGEARFAKHEKALEKALEDARTAEGRVRAVFKISSATAGSLSGDLAESTGTDLELNPANVAEPTEYLRRTAHEIPMNPRLADLTEIGKAFVAGSLLAEDRALIDALDGSEPQGVALNGDWISAVCGPPDGGGTVDARLNRVFLACETIPGAVEFAIRERGVKILYPDVEVRGWSSAVGVVGYVFREPEPDTVKLKMESDWRMLRRTQSTRVRLYLQATWAVEIAARAVIRIHR